MPKKIDFKILTPEKISWQGEIDSLTVPTEEGEITVLPNHLPLVSILKTGVATIRMDGKEEYFAISSGFLQVRPNNQVIILADMADRAEELALEEVEKAKQRAQNVLAQTKYVDEKGYNLALAALERELARLRVIKKKSKSTLKISSEETEQ